MIIFSLLFEFLRIGCLSDDSRYINSNFAGISNISGCFFTRTFLYNGNGGVISITATGFNLNVENSIFYDCGVTEIAGAIYFTSSGSVLKNVCARKCYANTGVGKGCQFCRIETLESGKNDLNVVSFVYCPDSQAIERSYSTYIINGIQKWNSLNGSNCYLLHICSRTYNPNSFSDIFSTYCNNRMKLVTAYHFSYGSNTRASSYINIINNTQDTDSSGIVHLETSGVFSISHSVCSNNNKFLFTSTGTLIVTNSIVSHSSSSLISGTVTITNNISNIHPNSPSTYNLMHHQCTLSTAFNTYQQKSIFQPVFIILILPWP